MVRFDRNFMNMNKVSITISLLIGLFLVVFMLMKLINMFKKSVSKENSIKGAPSKLPSRSRRVQTSMARAPPLHLVGTPMKLK